MSRKKYIFGFGNYIKGDDAIGIHIIDYINSHYKNDSFEAIEIGNNGMLFLTYFEDKPEKIVIVDCAVMEKAPGEYVVFSPDEVETNKVNPNISTHESDVIKLIQFAKELDYPMPDIKILAIEPKSFELDSGISSELKQKIPHYAKIVIDEIEKYS
jgi:hydrogenase maturation protease